VTTSVEVHSPGQAPRRAEVGERLLVGRSVDGLVLVDERCSRTHCELRSTADGVVVEDLGSTNGTYVDGHPIAAASLVRPGEEIVVGSTRIVVDPDRAPVRPALAPDAAATIDRLRASVVGGTVTIVFTDIVGSTALGAALGDRAWFAVLGRHDAVVRALVAEHAGTEIKHQGDGFMLSFPSARQGVRFGASLQRELGRARDVDRDFPVHVRIGVHTGEVLRVDGDLFGRHVNLAARVASAAGSGEVLVSRLVHDIVSAMGDLRFGPVREATLRGFDEPQLLYPLVDG
jgi:class 3 adenylate cyclase